MRLTCPNCGVQYEIPDDVIPPEGRKVECSGCGNTWFENHTEAERANQSDAFSLSDDLPDNRNVGNNAKREPTFREIEPPDMAFGSGDDGADAYPEEEYSPDFADQGRGLAQHALGDMDQNDTTVHPENNDGVRPSSGLDPAVVDVLRGEADYEARARKADTLETQSDLGLVEPDNEADRRLLQAKTRMRRLRGMPSTAPTSEELVKSTQSASRRELFPAIDDINTTLRGGADVASTDTEFQDETKKPSGFRLGFGVALLVALAAIIAYSNNDQVVQVYPPAGPYLDNFIVNANLARVWLDAQVTDLFLWLDSIAS